MVFGLFGHKKHINQLRNEVQDSFNHVKKDMVKISDWIKHIDDKKSFFDSEISTIKSDISILRDDISELEHSLKFLTTTTKRPQTNISAHYNTNKQMSTHSPNNVQTPVQSFDLDRLTVMERAIIWSLLNSELKLSYEDIAALLGKDKSTIRGQINTIKQKIPGLLSEVSEGSGKKRLFLTNDIKEEITKRTKVHIQ